jgi:hypothetical protein
MSNGVQIEFPSQAVDKLFAAMRRSANELNNETGKAFKQGVGYLIRSIGTSTAISPKYRQITSSAVEPPRNNLKAFDITGYFGRPRTAGTKTAFSRDKATAKRRHATIGARGLAKATWKRVGRDLFNVTAGMESGMVAKMAAKSVSSKGQFKGPDIFVEIHNFLPYINAALSPPALNSAFDRAARAMEHSIDNQLVKKMGLGSLSR